MNLRNLTPGLVVEWERQRRRRLAKSGDITGLRLSPKRELSIPERDEQIEILNWRN